MKLYSPFSPELPQQPHERLRWGQLHGAALSLAISSTAVLHQKPIIVVTQDISTANRLELELQFFSADLPVFVFPDWEMLPYDHFSPHQDIISSRLLTLQQLPLLTHGITIVSVNTLMHYLLPHEFIDAHSFVLDKGQTLTLDAFRLRLTKAGYRSVSQVMEHGEYAVRGSIIDLFPMGSPLPYRIDLFDNEVDSIRTFDTDTQRTIENITHIRLLPAREFPLSEEAITRFRQAWRNHFPGNPAQSAVYQNISQGKNAPGIEYYLPLFYESMQTLFDYFPKNSLIIRLGDTTASCETFWQEAHHRYEQLRYDITRPLLPPNELFLTTEKLFGSMKAFPQIHAQEAAIEEKAGHFNFTSTTLPKLAIDHHATQPLHALQAWLLTAKERVLFCVETAGRREVLLDLLKELSINPKPVSSWQEFLNRQDPINIAIAALESGMILTEEHIALIAEPQLYGQQVIQRRLRKHRELDPEAIIRDLTELNIGAAVVHLDYGVGRYLGLQVIKTGDIESEYLMLEYADNAKLYVPVSSLHLISRYSGAELENAPLNRLGSPHWEKAKRKAAEKIRDVAAELLNIYASRAAKKGFTFSKPEHHYAAFAQGFVFEETPDQERAILQVIDDMTSGKMMDRLVCGDVGFGKTEVAMRAAFIAVQSSKQVAILVPTTLLAEQHLHTCQDRFANWPIRVEAISRFRSKKEQDKIIHDLALGKIDIIIGTHKLLQSSVKFKSLGLLIVDEEHRFGVRQKERIKSMHSEIDMLALTATPIPRTLNMSLNGIRDLSIIATPPSRRLSIKTFVHEFDKSLVREAVLREILRGGQVYFLHNEVQTIEKMLRELQELIPEAKILIAHGQMAEHELERIMTDFYHLRFNVLLSTTIIESGIDIPTANTILINRADKFGLAQLHQLRGRVGRSHHQAYAYLLTPPKDSLSADAIKRLDAISSLEDLGAGFTLATHDLEIRGAGELLGENQSGHIQEIGFSLYMELLDQTVNALKSGKIPNLDKPFNHSTEIDLHLPSFIPEHYVHDVHTRLILYKRIANCKNQTQLQDLQVEMIDRFGLLPEQAQNLFYITLLKLKAQQLGIRKIDAGSQYGTFEFNPEPNIDPAAIIKLIQLRPKEYQLIGSEKLRFNIAGNNIESKKKAVETLLSGLQNQ